MIVRTTIGLRLLMIAAVGIGALPGFGIGLFCRARADEKPPLSRWVKLHEKTPKDEANFHR